MKTGAAVIIPTYNEARHIGGLLEQLLRQDEAVVGEILIADGRSHDDTRAIVERFAAQSGRVRLVDNPERVQAAGINRAVQAATAERAVLVRMDAHSRYPDDYVPRLLAHLGACESESVVVRLRTVGRTCMEKAIAAASNSAFGTGGSPHRVGGASGPVDHGHHAAFVRSAFERAGGYDTGFVANEDAELDYRLRKAGGRIWFASDIEVDYFPRSTLRALAHQYWRYGQGRAQNYLKHGETLKARQLAAPAIVLALAASILLGFGQPLLWLVPALYASGCAAAAVFLAVRDRSPCVLLAAPALATMHIGWGLGFLARIRKQSHRGKMIEGAR